jgi:hypothetical protein
MKASLVVMILGSEAWSREQGAEKREQGARINEAKKNWLFLS